MVQRILLLLFLAFFAADFSSGLTDAQEPKPARRILAIGGAANVRRVLPKYLIALTAKPNPVIVYLPTAGGDAPAGIVRWYETMNELECRPRHLRMFIGSKTTKKFEDTLLNADAIFVGGGNTLNMLAIWKAHGVDKILRQAWERGIVLCGESAGMICWFEQGITDSRPEKLTAMECLGFLKGSACPHYSAERDRKPTYHKMILSGELKSGIACDDGAAVLFEGDRLARAVNIFPKAKAYRVRREAGKIVEEPFRMELLK
jgi:peptidase E